MTTQEAYEKIRQYFNRPGAVLARAANGDCQYRTPDNQACAVGCLIPDDLYSNALEGAGVLALWRRAEDDHFGEQSIAAAKVVGYLHGVDTDFLRRAQYIHDNVARDTQGLVTMLDLLAEAKGLRPLNIIGDAGSVW